MTDRDHFAAAALTGLLSNHYFSLGEDASKRCYDYADAMLRERGRTNHDAAPAARARTDADSDRTDKAVSRPGEGTGDTPVTKPMPVFLSGSGSVTPVSYAKSDEKRVNWPTNRDTTPPRNGTPAEGSVQGESTEPVAWAVVSDSTEQIDCEFVYPDEATAGDVALDSNGGVVPLYRHPQPTLTDEERKTIEWAVRAMRPECRAVLQGLLERTK